ncbi:AAA family ATPase [Phycisphaerales bacterium AB-hyl4]|uniref:AAA family ATPase n=1 Tax=Natronomicrosphaera hydrolytica TaxID=3242702 RepID=A0ABV4U5H2_9BACT
MFRPSEGTRVHVSSGSGRVEQKLGRPVTFHGRKGFSQVRTIAIINQKGGCGKTTVSINLAATLAARGQRTLLVDMDPQGHCAMGLAVPEAQVDRSIADVLRAGMDGSIAFADVTWQIARHLDLVPAKINLAGVEQLLATAPDKDRRLAQVLSTVQDKYDFCVIDCPPSIGLLTFNALRAADEVFIPVETGYYALQGSLKQAQTIEMLSRRAGHDVRFMVLATMYDVRTKLAREILSELKRHFDDKLLPVVINFNAKLKEAASFGQPITEYDAASRGMQDFERLAGWLMSNPTLPTHDANDAPLVRQNPALSRAAELVERARALSARTASLAQRLASDPELRQENLAEPARREPPQPPIVPDEPDYEPAIPSNGSNGSNTALQTKLAQLYGVRPTAQGLLFIQPGTTGRRVAVVGDFNAWNPDASPMKRDESLGILQTCVPVTPGRYQYRLVIDGQWLPDPYNREVEPTAQGEMNNVVELTDMID